MSTISLSPDRWIVDPPRRGNDPLEAKLPDGDTASGSPTEWSASVYRKPRIGTLDKVVYNGL